MKIYFTCSTAEFIKYKKYYVSIRNFLIEEDHILTRDWIPHTIRRIKNEKVVIRDIKEIYDACIKAINDADLVIIEDTISNFSTGHQITIALQRQKPTLVLWMKPKHRHFNNTFIQAVDSQYLEVYEYNLKNYKDIISTFIKKYENANQKNRFHLVLDEVERKYLDWAQYSKNLSRTQIIRKSLRKTLDNDSEYQNYLRKS